MTVDEDIKRAVECMRKGGVILYPTDTVWGIGCDATNPEAVKKVYEIKKRDDSKALICLIDSADRMARYFRNVPQVAWDFIDAAMPVKPTTVILDASLRHPLRHGARIAAQRKSETNCFMQDSFQKMPQDSGESCGKAALISPRFPSRSSPQALRIAVH